MATNDKRRDRFLLIMLLAIFIGLPAAVWTYEQTIWQQQIPSDARVITLTGHTDKGWIVGDVKAYDIAGFGIEKASSEKPVIRVSKGEHVVFKLKSSDVVHGFSLKDLGIFIDDGIFPGIVELRCDVHAEMLAYIMVMKTPYFAVTDAQGHFTIPDTRYLKAHGITGIKNLPPGEYTLKNRHEKLKTGKLKVTVPADGAVEVELDLTRDRPSVLYK